LANDQTTRGSCAKGKCLWGLKRRRSARENEGVPSTKAGLTKPKFERSFIKKVARDLLNSEFGSLPGSRRYVGVKNPSSSPLRKGNSGRRRCKGSAEDLMKGPWTP